MSDEPDEMVASVEQWLAENPPKPVDQFLTERNEILRAEITRLRAELAEARDKALDEAAEAVCGYIHPAYGKLPGEPFATAVVLALKSPKPPTC